MKKERRHFRRVFENDYLLNEVMLVTGVKYVRSDNKFVAHVQYSDDEGGDVEKHIPVSEEWVKKEAGFANDVINYLLNLDCEKGIFLFRSICRLKLRTKKSNELKFVPEQKRNVLDLDEVLKLAEMRKQDLPLERSQSKMKHKQNKKEVPRKEITVPAHWSVVNAEGKRTSNDLNFLDDVLPTKFLNELRGI